MCSDEGLRSGQCDSVADFDLMGFTALYVGYLVRNWAGGGCCSGDEWFLGYESTRFGRCESRVEGVARISENNSIVEIGGAEGILF